MHGCAFFGVDADLPPKSSPATEILPAVDWKRLREALARARAEEGLTLAELEQASGVDQSTIHRIENIKKYPKHKPDLQTIEALVVIGMGRTISALFTEIERSHSSPLKDESGGAMTSDSPAPATLVLTHADPVPGRRGTLDYARLARELLDASAERMARAQQQAAGDRRRRAGSRARARKTRG